MQRIWLWIEQSVPVLLEFIFKWERLSKELHDKLIYYNYDTSKKYTSFCESMC